MTGNAELKLKGEMGLQINIGGYFDGICLTSYHMRFNSEKEVEQFISSLLWAGQRAEEVKKLLSVL